jgi:hypothetical protein
MVLGVNFLRGILTHCDVADLKACQPATNTALYPDGKFPDFSSRGRQRRRAGLRWEAFARISNQYGRVTDRSVQYPFGMTRWQRRLTSRIVAKAVFWSQQLTANNAQVGDVL